MPVRWCEERGLRYLSVEYDADMDERAAVATITEAAEQIATAGIRPVPVLVHPNGIRPTPGFLAVAKRLSHEVFAPCDVRLAVYDLGGLLRVLVNGFNNVGGGTRLMAWRTQEQAVDWLARSCAEG